MIVLLLFFILLFVLYNHSKEVYIKCLIIIFVAGKFCLFKAGFYYTPTIFNVIGVAIILTFLKEGLLSKYRDLVIISFILYFCYFGAVPLFLWGASVGNAMASLISYKGSLLYLLIGLQCYFWLENGEISAKRLLSFFQRVIAVEVILVIVQYVIPQVSDFFVIRTYEYGGQVNRLLDASFDGTTSKICTGTMLDPGSASLFLSIGLLIVMYAKDKLTKNSLIILSLIGLAIILCGVRAPLLGGLIGVAVYFVKGYKIRLKYLVIIGLVLVVIIKALGNLGDIGQSAYKDASREDPVTRAVSSAIVFSSAEDLENTTLSLAIILFPKFIESPIIGNGFHVAGRTYSLGNGSDLEDFSVTDAGIIFFLAEYGLIGLIIYLLPIIYVLKKYWKSPDRYKMWILLLVIGLNSVVDEVIFSDFILFVFYLTPLFLKENINGIAKIQRVVEV